MLNLISQFVFEGATSNGSPSYTPTIKVTTMVPSTTEASVTYARNTSTRTANYPQTPTLSITSEVSSSPAKITGTPTSVSRITHTFVNETPAVTTPSHVSTGTNPGKPKMTTGWVQNTFHASSGKSVETTVVETTVEGHTAVPTKEKAETVSFSESSFTTRPASDKINYTTAAPRTIVLSIPTTTSGTTGDTGSAPTGSDQRSDRTDSTTTMQQFDRTIANTETVSNPTVGNTNISTTEVNSQKTPMPTKESTHSTAGQRPSQYLSSKTRSAKPFTTVTMKSTVHTTISFQDLRLSTPKMFTTSSSLTASRNDIMTTTISSTELVITSPPTEQTLQYKTSPKENNTSTQKSQGHQMHDDKTADGMIIYIALVSGIAAAVGIAILIPLFVFVLKSLCTAAKVAPDAG